MSAKIFKTPGWDDDVDVPERTFNFKKKANKKNKKKPKSIDNDGAIESHPPGRYVLLHRDSEPDRVQPTKRKFTESTIDVGDKVESPNKKKKLKNQNDNNEPVSAKNKKLKNQNDKKELPTSAKNKNVKSQNDKQEPTSAKKKKLKNVPFTKKLPQTDQQDEDDSEQLDGNNSFRQTLIDNLKGSRFRYLNELLYSKPSGEATAVFEDDPTSFQAYHEGYRQQVQQWPLNPLDRMINALKRLPRNLVVADFGCGEARLARTIPQKTYSLDLVAKTEDIIACDMANTPLETGSIDVVVFCLSLMGTNIKDFILEANRVLKDGGQLKIAEVESRFTDIRHFVANIKQCGFELVHQDVSNNLFYFLNFKKTKMVKKTSKTVSSFSLKPCIYKKR
ncbi:ribosomal RNA-processing protein 8 [Bradysia coprophila]|uniref:ribosomal RNA-processing protein 8 n=1 Tax=Bradysia coprophila TaxID=38358 RepID=UPI00187DC3B3|nr:ribosomal RNA-processing protein 8 [Bradysia coprophila]